jgi:hypothetical protein
VIREPLLDSRELHGSDLKAVKNVTLLRCVVFAWACEISRVRPSAGASRRPCLNLDSHIIPLKSQHIESEMVKLKSEPFDDLSRGTQNTPSNRVAFMQPVPEVDEGESSEGKTMEAPSMQRIRLIAGEVAAAVTPIAKLRPEEEPATAKTRYRPRPSSSQRTLGQYPTTMETPRESIHPGHRPGHCCANHTTSKPDCTFHSETDAGAAEAKGPSTPGRNGKGDAEDGLALPPWESSDRKRDSDGVGATQVVHGGVWTIYN